MNPLLPLFLSALLRTTILMAAAWPVIFMIKRQSAARISSTGRIIMLTALMVFTWTMASGWPHGIEPSRAIPEAVPALPEQAGPAEKVLLSAAPSPAVHASPARSSRDFSSTFPLLLTEPAAMVLATLWLAGFLFALIRWLDGLRLRNQLFRATHVLDHKDWLTRIGSLGTMSGLKMVRRIRLHPNNIPPCVWGVWNSVMVLPVDALAWPMERLRLTLAHECAHLRRRDPLWQVIGNFFTALLWFHPAAWSIAKRGAAADERAADDAVLNTGTDRAIYAELLLNCARTFSGARSLLRTTTAMASGPGISARIEALLDPSQDRRTLSRPALATRAALLACLAVTACFHAPAITMAMAEPAIPPAAETSSSPEKPATRPKETAAEPAAPSVPPQQQVTENHVWNPVMMDGREYLPATEVASFYKFSLSTVEAESLSFTSHQLVMKWELKSPQTLRINKLLYHLQHPILESKGQWMISRWDLGMLLEPVLHPGILRIDRPLKTVVIDPGHGGVDSGTMGIAGKEADVNLDIATRLKDLLENGGLRVVMTRSADDLVSADARIAVANQEDQADSVFCSIHCNSGRPSLSGIETFYAAVADTGPQPLRSVALATAIHAATVLATQGHDIGIRPSKFKVLTNKLPGVLIDCGFLSHPVEGKLLGDAAHRQKLADSIGSGLLIYRNATKP